jgi:hypothetical protein
MLCFLSRTNAINRTEQTVIRNRDHVSKRMEGFADMQRFFYSSEV